MTSPPRDHTRLTGLQLLLLAGWLLLALALGLSQALRQPADRAPLRKLGDRPPAARVLRLEGRAAPLGRDCRPGPRTAAPARRTGTR